VERSPVVLKEFVGERRRWCRLKDGTQFGGDAACFVGQTVGRHDERRSVVGSEPSDVLCNVGKVCRT
jgi:hypothetical protein